MSKNGIYIFSSSLVFVLFLLKSYFLFQTLGKKTNAVLPQSLSVIEYLVAHGSERAVDEIVEHTYQIAVPIFIYL